MTEMTRHDIPPAIMHLLTVAEEQGLIDIFDVFTLGVKFGGQYAPDWQGLIDEISEYAYVTRNEDGGRKHHIVCEAANHASGFLKGGL